MKKLLLILFLFFSTIEMKAQKLPWYQSGDFSCWAASLGRVATRIGEPLKDQCFFVKYKDSFSLCLPDTNNAGTIDQAEMSLITRNNLFNYTGEKYTSLGLNYIKHLIGISKPLIYNFRYDGGSSHIMVMDSIENQVFNALNQNISFIKISDPWPVNKGNEYYITYERYYSQSYNNIEPSTGVTGKYTLFYNDNSESFLSGITDIDKVYLHSVLHQNTPTNLVTNFLNILRDSILDSTNMLSNSFFKITNLPKNDIGTLTTSLQYSLLSLSVDSLVPNLIPTILNMKFNEKLISINKNDTTISMMTVSNKKKYGTTTYKFYNNWILYHIEKGNVLQKLHEDALLRNMKLAVGNDNDGIIIQSADTYFAITEKNETYYAYDLYGDGFNKIKYFPVNKEDKFLAFNTFQKLLKINFYNKN